MVDGAPKGIDGQGGLVLGGAAGTESIVNNAPSIAARDKGSREQVAVGAPPRVTDNQQLLESGAVARRSVSDNRDPQIRLGASRQNIAEDQLPPSVESQRGEIFVGLLTASLQDAGEQTPEQRADDHMPPAGEEFRDNDISTKGQQAFGDDLQEVEEAAGAGSGGAGDEGRREAAPSPDEPQPFSADWLSTVEINNASTVQTTDFMREAAKRVLGDTFDDNLWNYIMLPVQKYDEDNNPLYVNQSRYAMTTLRSARELARGWKLSGDSPGIQALAVMTFLKAEEKRRSPTNGSAVTVYQMTEVQRAKIIADPTKRVEISAEVRLKRQIKNTDDKEAKALRMRAMFAEFVRNNNLQSQLPLFDALAEAPLYERGSQAKRVTSILSDESLRPLAERARENELLSRESKVYQDILEKFSANQSEELTQQQINIIERSLTLIPPEAAEFIKKNYGIGTQREEVDLSKPRFKRKLRSAQRDLTIAATKLEAGELDLKAWKRKNPECRSVLILLDHFGLTIPDEAPIETLNQLAIAELQKRAEAQAFPGHYVGVMIDLYGLKTGRQMTTGQAGEASGRRDSEKHMTKNTIRLAEHVVLGLLERDRFHANLRHPDRDKIVARIREREAALHRGAQNTLSNRGIAKEYRVSSPLVNRLVAEERARKQQASIHREEDRAAKEGELLDTITRLQQSGSTIGKIIDVIRYEQGLSVSALIDIINASRHQSFSDYEAPVQVHHITQIFDGSVTPARMTVDRLLKAVGYEPGTPIGDFVSETAQQEILEKQPAYGAARGEDNQV